MAGHNLPTFPTPFIGRADEIAELSQLLDNPDCRLLTLVGPGGIGKTRLAIAVAAEQVSRFAEGVWLADLQPVNSAHLIVPTIAEAIGLSFRGSEDPQLQLLSYLSDKAMLLLFDNFEQFLSVDGTHLLADILTSASSVKLLITSREALNLKEEWRYPVTGLSAPSAATGDNLESYDAIQLFGTCARRVSPSFNLADERDCILRICDLVDGMPLAIEMATSWLSALPCEAIAMRIARGLLDTRLQNVPARHRSMRTVFAQSWSLLDETERRILCQLSVFTGGFRIDAVEQITGAGPGALAALADKSLLQLGSSGRFKMHELIRQSAREQLDAMPMQRETTLDLHCDYYTTFLYEREQKFRIEQAPRVTAELQEEIDNIRAAWNRVIEHRKIDQIREAIWCLTEWYDFRGWFHEGEHLLGRAVEVLSEGQPVSQRGVTLGLALVGQGNFLHYLGQIERAKPLMHDGVALLRSLNALRETAHAISLLSRLYYMTGDLHKAEKSYRESVALATKANDYVTLSFGFLNLGLITSNLGRYHEARLLLQNSLAHFRHIDHRLGIAITLDALGGLSYTMGDYAQAKQSCQEAHTYLVALDSRWHLSLNDERRGTIDHILGNYEAAAHLLQESLMIGQQVNDPRRIASCLIRLGHLCSAQLDFEQAQVHYRDGLIVAREAKQRLPEASCLCGLGRVAYETQHYTQAYRYLHGSLEICREIDWKLGIAQVLNELGRASIRMGKHTDAQHFFHESLQTGTEIGVPPITLETTVGIAELLADQGALEQATQLLTCSLHHPASHAETRQHATRLLERLEAELSTEVFSQMCQWGLASELDQVVAALLGALSPTAPSGSHLLTLDPLTRRELEILRLLATRRTNQEIADELVISVGTVKTHVHNICGKLRVPDRRQAAARARELLLLENQPPI